MLEIYAITKMANLTKFRHLREFGIFDDISPKERMSSREWYRQTDHLTNPASSARMTNLTIFRQRSRLERMSSREGYQQSGDFDESGEFGENDEFENISPKIEITAKFVGFVKNRGIVGALLSRSVALNSALDEISSNLPNSIRYFYPN